MYHIYSIQGQEKLTLNVPGGGRAVELNSDVIGCASCHGVSYLEIASVAVVVIGCQRRFG